MKSDFEIDHIGIAVKSLDQAFAFYKALGWSILPKEVVESEKVQVGFLKFKNHADIELLEAIDSESTIAKFISKRGEGIHHICIRVTDIHESLKNLKAAGVRLINESPKKGAKNCLVAFVHPSSANGVLIELSQSLNKDKT